MTANASTHVMLEAARVGYAMFLRVADRQGMTMGEQDARLMTITTAPQLADYLNVDAKKLRGWLRKEFPAQALGQGDEWRLTPTL